MYSESNAVEKFKANEWDKQFDICYFVIFSQSTSTNWLLQFKFFISFLETMKKPLIFEGGMSS